MSFSFDPFPELLTSRLRLRDYKKEDYAQVFFLRSDKQVNKFIKRKPAKNMLEAEAFVKKVRKSMSEGKNVNWAITYHSHPDMIGSICIWNFSPDLKTGEIGYDLHPDHQKKGIMQEAMQAVIQYGFDILKLDNLKAYTNYTNLSSIKLLQKNGFELTEEKDSDDKNNVILRLKKSIN